MRKLKKGRKLSRKRDQRKALIKSILNSFFIYGKIKTTEAKAKEISRFAEKIITKAKNGGVFQRRFLARSFGPKTVKKIIEEIAPKYKERKGGYLRIIKLGPRQSDGAKMAIIELIK